jgi:beta-galactosidase/beta-glucuronidase
MQQPRPEHPRPQFQRPTWVNLNGAWDYALDFGMSGDQRNWQLELPADGTINVPYCPESRLSGVGLTDFIPSIWYHREISVPPDWRDLRVLLHFGAVDFDCRAWINGRLVGRHCGGSSSFAFDITDALKSGGNQLTVCARDDVRSPLQASGKQSSEYQSHGCVYTRTTGIWQTVWLEGVPASHISRARIVPDLDGGRFLVTPDLVCAARGQRVRVRVLEGGKQVAAAEAAALSGGTIAVDLPEPRAWSPAQPHLYDLSLELLADGQVLDHVDSYAGLRKFHIEGNRFYLNNRPIFLRLVLDQGFYPDGIWTAPDDAALRQDIELSMAAGFNGARLHQKVFEERFHYWADRLGYLTWGEYCDWGMDFTQPQSVRNQQREWREIVMRDMNHPSILVWTPFNETAGQLRGDAEGHRQVVQETVDLTRGLDPARPVNDTSGYVHVCTDIFTVHDYDQDPDTFAQRYASVDPGRPDQARVCSPDESVPYSGQPYVVDEYGGTWWVEASDDGGTDRGAGWGYGNRPGSIDEVYQRIQRLTAALTGHPHIAGFTYTQLTDVEQEQNGIYTFDRRPKFDTQRLRRAFGTAAAMEAD